MKFKLNLCLAFLLAAPCAFGQVMSGSTPNPDYSGLQLWLKADAGIAAASGSAVMVWTNQSASPFAGANATSQLIGSANAPTYVAAAPLFNGQPAVEFNGTSQGLDLADSLGSFLANSSYTTFAVMATAGPNTTSSWHAVQVILANNSNSIYLYSVDPWMDAPLNQYLEQYAVQNGSAGNWAVINSTNGITNNTAYILSAASAGTVAGGTRLYLNGAQNDNATPEAAFSLSTNWTLGYQANAAEYFHGQIAELMIYQGVLSEADRLAITAYLGAKYALAVSPPATAMPTNNPPAGIYSGAQAVNLAAAAGATIAYTTDGSNPTNSTTALSGVSPNVWVTVPAGTNLTLMAFATLPGRSPSAVTKAIYDTVATNPAVTVVSQVKTLPNGKRVLYVDGKPFQAYGGQLRVDTWRNYAGYTDAQMSALNLFSWATNLDLNVVQVPIYWGDIEPYENQFNWIHLQWAIDQCRTNGVRMEVLWFGADVTGTGGTSIQPGYVLNDSGTYPLVVSSNGVLEANQTAGPDGCEHTVCKEYASTAAAEANALFNLMQYLQANDTQQVVIGVQIEDEPSMILNADPATDRCHCPLCNSLFAAGTYANSLDFCKQRLAVYLNQMAAAVKMSPYQVWVRVNWADPFSSYDEDVSAMQDLATKVDFIGWDPYGETQASRFAIFTNAQPDGLSAPPNTPFACEEPGGQDATCRQKIIDTFAANGMGCEFYRVDTYSTNAGVDNYLLNPDGTDARPWTDAIRQTFGLLRKVMSKTAVLRGGNNTNAQIQYFNSFGNTRPIYHGTNLLAGVGLQYSTTAGGVGLAFADGSDLVLMSDLAGSFRLNGGSGVFENGYYDADGNWVAVSAHAASTNTDGTMTISLSPGTPYEVVKFARGAARPVISEAAFAPGGYFQLTLSGLAGQAFRVLSTNLLEAPPGNWPVVGTGTFGDQAVSFTDFTGTISPRFYRVVSP